MVAWEVAIGRLASIAFSGLSNGAISLFMFNRLRRFSLNKSDAVVLDEFLLEAVRRQSFQNEVSRLQGLYFFENEEDALRANCEWEFNLPEHYLCSFDIDEKGITKVDSEWITHKLRDGNADGWMERYWSGECYGSTPLMELIVADGIGLINNRTLRQEAYKLILAKYPGSTRLLSASCCLFSRGIQTISQIVPCLVWDGTVVSGDYIINLGDLEKIPQGRIQQIFNDCAKEGSVPQWIPHPDPNVSFEVPDFRSEKFEIQPTSAQLPTIKAHFAP